MHKLINKHTGEEVTTPYMAEVEEYLNSGDYEMSDKKYPYIGKSELTDRNYVVFGENNFYSFKTENFHNGINQENLKNITQEYLANTYGKCESQEHADFICELAESAGFRYINDYNKGAQWFSFDRECVDFYNESCAKNNNEKLIQLPPPPKEKEMQETKPVYTKEMYERGELPPIGSIVEKVTGKGKFDYDVFAETYDDCCIPNGWDVGAKLEVIAHTEISGSILPVVKHDDLVSAITLSSIKPIPTIEDELIEFIDCGKGLKSIIIAKGLLEKYNITPKECK